MLPSVEKSTLVRVAGLLLLFGLLSGTPDGLHGEGGPSVQLYEKKRSLVILPFANLSSDPTIEYLSTGIPGMITGKLRQIPYVVAESPRPLFSASPEGIPSMKDQGPGQSRLPLTVQFNRNQSDDLNEENAGLARSLGADYLIRGKYRIKEKKLREKFYRNDEIEIEIFFYDAIAGLGTTYQATYELEGIYRDLEEIALRIQKKLTSGRVVQVFVESERAGAMAYLDEIYLGRTPVRTSVLPGEYTLMVEEEGYETYSRKVRVVAGADENQFYASMVPLLKEAGLYVISEPTGADVYLDIQRIGKTPLELDNLPPGTHRVRVSMDGYVDSYKGVDLYPGKTSKLAVTLLEGDTEEYFSREKSLVMDWTNHDFAFYSFLSSLFFYGGYYYFDERAKTVRDSVRPYVLTLNPTEYPFNSLYYNYILEQKRTEADRIQRKSYISAGISVALIVSGGAFLWRDLIDENDIGEVEIYGAVVPSGGFDPSPTYSMGMTYRF